MPKMADDETGSSEPAAPAEGFFDHRITYRNSKGKELSPMECVVPIGFYDPTINLFHPIATGVFIAVEGLVCTARHAFQFEPRFRETMAHLSDRSYPAIYQYLPDHTYTIRAIAAVHPHPKYDLAIAVCEPIRHIPTDTPFDNNMHAMTIKYPPIGTRVHQYSYPDPILFDQEGTLQIMMIPLCTEGTIIDWFPDGMGSLFPSPAYVIEGYIGAGSSGGPVMDESGRVFAISSRGCDAENYYYAIPAREMADIRVTSIVLGTPPVIHGPTIREMVARRMISFVSFEGEGD